MGQIEEIARTFGVDWTHLIAQIVSFGIVCAVLYKLAYRPILQHARGAAAADRERPGQRREDQGGTGSDREPNGWPSSPRRATKAGS